MNTQKNSLNTLKTRNIEHHFTGNGIKYTLHSVFLATNIINYFKLLVEAGLD